MSVSHAIIKDADDRNVEAVGATIPVRANLLGGIIGHASAYSLPSGTVLVVLDEANLPAEHRRPIAVRPIISDTTNGARLMSVVLGDYGDGGNGRAVLRDGPPPAAMQRIPRRPLTILDR